MTIFRLEDQLRRLPLPSTARWPAGVWDVEVVARQDATLSMFAPREIDHQGPHDRDELYLIASGEALFVLSGATGEKVRQGDAILVAAGREHRFEEMSSEFATWVVFLGPAAQ